MKRRDFIKSLSLLAASSSFSQLLLAEITNSSSTAQKELESLFLAELGETIEASKLWAEKDIPSLHLDKLLKKLDASNNIKTILINEIEHDFDQGDFIYLPVEQMGHKVGEYTLSFTEVRCHLLAWYASQI